MIADIARGDTGAADVLFLVGAVLAVLAGLMTAVPAWAGAGYRAGIGWLAVACLAVGWVLL